ncbi:hypothetical protein VaNZ11_004488 [Volvox africanus]|uniref:Protein ENHANCED DISEASE RESISTANCE 2 C-terminal domain-containing protein n=1 Tax=Volvox africanus TaxID=51714 RepID=A0ABQ5RWZ5_9CHLO|nr:hypothetical protein VaNZ11_004488 [Volvox africanus]
MAPLCCCFGKRSANRRSMRTQGRQDAGKGKHDDLQSPLSCESFRSEYYDAQENFSVTEGLSPPCSTSVTPRPSVSYEKHHSQGITADTATVLDAGLRPCDGECGATAVAAVSIPVDGECFQDGQLAGTSETSEELHQGGGGAISKLASCLSILDAIRMPGSAGTPTAAGAASTPSPFGSSATQLLSGGPVDGATSGRPTSRRPGRKLEPGSTLLRRDMSTSVLDVQEAWDECDDDNTPSSSGRPFMVRSVDYMRTKVKVPSHGALYRLLAADVISSDTKLTHVARVVNIQHMLRPAVDPHLPPLLIITIMLPMYPATLFGGNDGPSQSLVYYFALPPDFNPVAYTNQQALALLRRLMTNGREADGSPTRDRFKLIPRVVNVDEWALKGPLSPAEHKLLATYNDKPILTRPQHFFFNGPGYLEVDIDIHSYQFLARKAFGAYFGRLKEVIFENAFVIQGNNPEELPEQVLAAVRMYRIDLMRNRPLREFIIPAAAAASAFPNQPGLPARWRSPMQHVPSPPPPIPEAADEPKFTNA